MTYPALALFLMIQMSGPPSTSSGADAVVDTTDVGDEAVAAGDDATDHEDEDDEDKRDDDKRDEGATTDEGDGTRPFREDLPSTSSSRRMAPDAAVPDPTFTIWLRSFGFMCGTQFATLIGCFPGLFVVFIGGAAINELGADLTGRQGTAATTVAMFGGGAVALLVGGASTLVGLGVAYSGGGGSGLLIPSGPADPATQWAGAGIAVAGLVGGAALGALLPTAAWLTTAEPVPEGPASW